MAQKTITNFTVVDEDHRGYQIGFRNLFNSRNEALVELRLGGSDVATIPMEDFKKLVLAAERMSELLAKQEILDEEAATTTTA